ncbi:MAG: sigma-54 dependent transcriptional regulator [Bacteroidales bacterium]|nr:sigma-54 dependent transcriptional regulator [Bacteroidales bacterium]
MDTQELQKLKNAFDIVGNDPGLNRALETATMVAPTDITVLISGESGTGKEVLPQIIHKLSRRKNGRYLAVNCGAIPPGTINAELFGHEKGSFTGAIGERKGYFEEADGGTLFLDEIGELPKETQALLLRVLQSGEFMKVGSSKVEKTDVRIIAATNVNLLEAVHQGKFREDLYYRLCAVQIRMPALRDRREDIYLLFRKFTSDFSEKYNICKISLSHDAITLLRDYRWPGNIRQLKNVAETISALESKPVTPGAERIELNASAISGYLPDEQDSLLPAIGNVSQGQGNVSDDEKRAIVKAIFDLKQEVDRLRRIVEGSPRTVQAPEIEKQAADDAEWQDQQEQHEVLSIRKNSADLIEKALDKHNRNVKAAAAELGISERTIYRKLAEKKVK